MRQVLLFGCLLAAGFIYASNDVFMLDSIVVTSDRVSDNAIDKTSYDTAFLETNMIESVEDLGTYVPSLSISNYGSRNVVFTSYRGHSNFMTTQSPLALYIDDMPLTNHSTFLAQELFNISSVTVLKGPQGFETGLGAQAGIIKLQTDEQITDRVQGSLEAGVANYREHKAVAHLTVPLDSGAASIDALYRKRDGFTTNLYNDTPLDDEQTKALSAKIIKNLTESFRFTLQAMLSDNDDGGTPYQREPYNAFEMNQNINGYVRQKNKMAAVKLDWFGDDLHVRSVTSYSDYDSPELLDADRTPEDFIELRSDQHIKQLSEEVTADYLHEDEEWIGGLFLSHQYASTYEERHDFNYLDVRGYRLWQTSQPEDEAALFATCKKRLDTDWQMDIGLRYSVVRKKFDNLFTQYFPIVIPEYGFVNGADSAIDDTVYWYRLLPKLSLSYETDNHAKVYFTYSRGFKSGGYSYDDYNISTAAYEPEDSDTLELGYAAALHDGLIFSASLYATRIDNLQVEIIHPDLSSSIDNSAKADIYGLEAQLQYALTPEWSMQSALAFTRARYREYASNGVDYSGSHIINVPDFTFFIGSRYDFNRAFFLNASLRSHGRTYFDKANALSQSSYTLADIMVGYHADGFSCNLYLKNAFDKRYFNNIAATGEEFAYNFGEPRRIGVNLRYAFK